MLERDRAFLDAVHVHAGLVREGLASDEGHVVRHEDVGDLGHAADGRSQRLHLLVGDAGIAPLKLQIGDQGRQVDVAAALAEARQRSLNMRRAGLDRRQGVGDAEAAVVVRVDADGRPAAQAGHDRRRAARHLVGKTPPVRLAQADHVGTGIGRRGQGLERVVRRGLPSVEKVFGIEDDPFLSLHEPRHGVADDPQVFGACRPQDLGDMQIPGFAEDHDDIGAGLQQAVEIGIIGRRQLRTAGGAEGGEPGLPRRPGRNRLEEGEILGIRAGIARLDQGDAQLVQRRDDRQLVMHGERDALGLRPVAQRGVQNFQVFHQVHSFPAKQKPAPTLPGCAGICRPFVSFLQHESSQTPGPPGRKPRPGRLMEMAVANPENDKDAEPERPAGRRSPARAFD